MLTEQQTITILTAICHTLDGSSPSAKTVKPQPREADAVLAGWWIVNQGEYHAEAEVEPARIDNPYNTPDRPSAYLRAYLAIVGDRIPARGVPLAEGQYLWLDKGVMKSLLLFNLIELEQGHFELTARGRAFLRGEAAARGGEVV